MKFCCAHLRVEMKNIVDLMYQCFTKLHIVHLFNLKYCSCRIKDKKKILVLVHRKIEILGMDFIPFKERNAFPQFFSI